MKKANLALLLGLLAGASGACGYATDSDYQPTVMTLQGQVTGAAPNVTHALRVALLWQATEGNRAFVLQETEIEPVFPARFKLRLNSLPPRDALRSWESIETVNGVNVNHGTVREGSGYFVVYEDLNDNGHFDLIPPGAENATDRLLADGDNGNTMFQYYEGPPVAVAVAGPHAIIEYSAPPPVVEEHVMVPGFNIYTLPLGPATGDGCIATPCREAHPYGYHWMDPSDIELPLNLPAFSMLQCEQWSAGDNGLFPELCPDRAVPAGWGTFCFPDVRRLVAIRPHGSDPICTVTRQACVVTLSATEPLPPEWPCR